MTEQNSTFSFDTWIWHTEWFDIFHGDFFSPFNHFAVISQILAKYQCQMVSVFFSLPSINTLPGKIFSLYEAESTEHQQSYQLCNHKVSRF